MRRFKSGSYRSQAFIDVDEVYPQEISGMVFAELATESQDPVELAVSCQKLSESEDSGELLRYPELIRMLMGYKRHWQIQLAMATSLKNLVEEGEHEWVLNEIPSDLLCATLIEDSYRNSTQASQLFLQLAQTDGKAFANKVYADAIDDSLADFVFLTDNDDACNNVLKVFQELWLGGGLAERPSFNKVFRGIANALDKRSDSDLHAECLEFLAKLFTSGGAQMLEIAA
jgi:hypothetical protein